MDKEPMELGSWMLEVLANSILDGAKGIMRSKSIARTHIHISEKSLLVFIHHHSLAPIYHSLHRFHLRNKTPGLKRCKEIGVGDQFLFRERLS